VRQHMKLFQNIKEKIENLFSREKTGSDEQKFDTARFLELVSEFEVKIKEELQFELLQVYYAPYAFGSGHVAYKIKGRNVQITYDGRDNAIGERPIEVSYSKPYAKFPTDGWIETKTYTLNEFWDAGVREILEKSKSRK
ncbi:MAG: hypothetical protein LH478_10120, partial [Chitinophagaceae bacterium]|nr:hypothetical protein [Chitinophagaceae bacterium]